MLQKQGISFSENEGLVSGHTREEKRFGSFRRVIFNFRRSADVRSNSSLVKNYLVSYLSVFASSLRLHLYPLTIVFFKTLWNTVSPFILSVVDNDVFLSFPPGPSRRSKRKTSGHALWAAMRTKLLILFNFKKYHLKIIICYACLD